MTWNALLQRTLRFQPVVGIDNLNGPNFDRTLAFVSGEYEDFSRATAEYALTYADVYPRFPLSPIMVP